MGEESLRGGFTNGMWVTGEIFPKLRYKVMVGNNLSSLGYTSRETYKGSFNQCHALVDAYYGRIWTTRRNR